MQTDTALLNSHKALYGLPELRPTALKVLFLAADAEGCSWYRGRQPGNAINVTYPNEVNQVHTQTYSVLDETVSENNPKWDVLVTQRQAEPKILEWTRRMKEQHKLKHIYEIDDDVYHVEHHSAFAPYYTKERIKQIQNFMSAADCITVSTEALKRLYTPLNPNIVVIPNAVDYDIIKDIQPMLKMSHEIIIGWSGSASHLKDLENVMPAVRDVLLSNKNIVFQIGGWINCPLLEDLPQDQVRKLPWTNDMSEYFKTIKSVDIGLCPLADTKFNEGKSNLRVIEYGAAGVPVIASAVGPYADTIKDGKHGILIKSSGKEYLRWKSALNTLINDVKLRKALAMNLTNLVKEKYDQVKVAEQWKNTYIKVVKG